jgi:hypothetical protein
VVNPAGVRRRRSVLPWEISGVSGNPDRAGRKARDRGGEVSRGLPRGPSGTLIHRTDVYGAACPVVWEGEGREADPYPD